MRRYILRFGQVTLFSALLVGIAASSSIAAFFTVDFEGLQDLERVQNYYNGGTGSFGTGPGNDYGVSFSNNARALIDSDAGGSGNFANEPTPDTVFYFDYGMHTRVNVGGGFDSAFSFYYTTICFPATVRVYSGLNGSGSLLTSAQLPATGYGTGDPTGAYGSWGFVDIGFTGTARSVVFNGMANQIAFDNLSFGRDAPTDPVPEPASLLLLGPGLLGFILTQKRRFSV